MQCNAQCTRGSMLDAGISIMVVVTCILLFVRTRAYLDVGPIAIISPSWNSQRISLELEAAIMMESYNSYTSYPAPHTPIIITASITASITITPFPPLLSLRVLLLLLRLLLLPCYYPIIT